MLKRLFAVLLIAALPFLANAQISGIPVIEEIIRTNTVNNSSEPKITFNMPQDGVDHYYLCVGHLGIGDEILQVYFDPVTQLYIPLGNTIDEALGTLDKLLDLLKEDPGTQIQLPGCLAFPFPTDELEQIDITCNKVLFGRNLEFCVHRSDHIRATFIEKSDVKAMISGLKFYRKIYPDKP